MCLQKHQIACRTRAPGPQRIFFCSKGQAPVSKESEWWNVIPHAHEYVIYHDPLNIQPVVVLRGLKRQHAAALTNFVRCFLALYHFFFLSLLCLCRMTLPGPSAGPLAGITYSIPYITKNICHHSQSPLHHFRLRLLVFQDVSCHS